MKIALVHELLTIRGGAERVLKVLADMYPDAPIYTLLYDEKKLSDWFPKERVRVSSLQQTALHKLLQATSYFLQAPLFNHHLYLKKFPRAVEAWDFSQFDIVISTSSAFAHGIITNGSPKHLSYIHSPARYLWDRTHDVLRQASKGLLGPLKSLYLSHVFHHLRQWDAEVADRPDALLAASKAVKRRIELYWRRESTVLTPPIDDSWLQCPTPVPSSERKGYVIVSSLRQYKRIELAVLACNALKRPLTIIGEGPFKKELQKIAGPTISFSGYLPHEKIQEAYRNAKATLFPGEEDFGLVPLESLACGTPVIAYGGGGALETICEGETGEFFDEATAESLSQAIEKYEQKKYSYEKCQQEARQHTRAKFEEGIRKSVENLWI